MFDGLRHRLYVLLRGERYARETQRELEFHVELETLARGRQDEDREAAELEARRRLGNATYYREEVRRLTVLGFADRVRQDVTYAWRGFIRAPGFTLTVVGTIGLGVGVNAAVFSIVDRAFLRAPSGVQSAGELRRLYVNSRLFRSRNGSRAFPWFSYPRVLAIREEMANAVEIAAYSPSSSVLMRSGAISDSALVSYADPSYFSVLGLRPQLGRFFVAEEGRVESPTPVAVISDALWRRRFDADPNVLGRAIELRGRRFTVVGIGPPDFAGLDLDATNIWVPANCWPVAPGTKEPWYRLWGNYFRVVARPGSPALESRLIAAGTAALRAGPPGAQPDSTITLVASSIIDARGPAARDAEIDVSARTAAVALMVLLIACANVANMLLLRSAERRREIAVRRALGVSAARLCCQLVIESVLLALAGAAVALLLATWSGTALRRLLLPGTHWSSSVVDARIVAVTVGAALAIGLAVSVVPAMFAAGVDVASSLKSGRPRGRTRASRSQQALLITQAALSIVLVVAAGLFVRSLQNILSIDLGYQREGILTARVFASGARANAVYAELPNVVERIRALPGVSAVSSSMDAPMTGYATARLFLPGRDSTVKIDGEEPTSTRVNPGYFAASGVRLLAGRDFSAEDRAGTAPVVIVGKAVAQALWPGESPLGKCVMLGAATNPCTRVIGVVDDVHRMNVIENVIGQYYLPLAQSPGYTAHGMVVHVADARIPAVRAALRAELLRLMPDQADFRVQTMDELLDRDLHPWRVSAVLFTSLAVLALIVAAIGVYGVVSYSISQRTHEMGVRVALGARRRDIFDLVVGAGVRTVAMGLAIGVGIALLLGRFVASSLFGVVPSDTSVLLGALSTMLAVATLASLVPAWRAARADPVSSLRAE